MDKIAYENALIDEFTKMAKDKDKKHYLGYTALIGSGLVVTKAAKPFLTGRETFYHGTTPDNVKKIKKNGLLSVKSSGNKAINTDFLNSSDNDIFFDGSRAKVHKRALNYAYASPSKKIAENYSAQSQTGGLSTNIKDKINISLITPGFKSKADKIKIKSGIINLDVPIWQNKKRMNPEIVSMRSYNKDFLGSRAGDIATKRNLKTYQALTDVESKYIKGSKDFTPFYKEFGQYIKHSPGKFAKGVGFGLAGATAISLGVKGLLSKKSDNQMVKKAYDEAVMNELNKIANINLGKDQSLNTGALGGLVGSGIVSTNMVKSQLTTHKDAIKEILKSTMGKAEKVKRLAPYLTAVGVAGAVGSGIGALSGKYTAKGLEKMLIHKGHEKRAEELPRHPQGFGATVGTAMKHPIRFAGNVLGGTAVGMGAGSVLGAAVTAPTLALASGLMARRAGGSFREAFGERMVHGLTSEAVGGGVAGGLMGAGKYFKNQAAGKYDQVKQAAFVAELKKLANAITGGVAAGGMKAMGAMANKTAPELANKLSSIEKTSSLKHNELILGLEKKAVNLSQLRKANEVLKKNIVRGAIKSTPIDGLRASNIGSQLTRRGTSASTISPTISKASIEQQRVAFKAFKMKPSKKQEKMMTDFGNVGKGRPNNALILMGHNGGMGAFSKIQIKNKLTSKQKETFNRMVIEHEGFESRVKKPIAITSHPSPEVLYREHNIVTTLPKRLKPAGTVMRKARHMTNEDLGLNIMHPNFKYGKSPRLSRHAIKRMNELDVAMTTPKSKENKAYVKRHTDSVYEILSRM